MFYDKKEIYNKALKLYDSGKFFISFMQNTTLFPYTINLKKLNQNDITKNLAIIFKEIKQLQDSKLNIEYKEFKFKSIGSQKLPISIVFKDENDFLKFINKSEEFASFRDSYEKSIKEFSQLKELFLHKPNLLLNNIEIVDELLEISSFFTNNPTPNIYIRELSIMGVDTKFIEQNRVVVDNFLQTILHEDFYDKNISSLSKNGFEKKYGLKYELPAIRFRILDEDLYINGLSDITVNIKEFQNLNFASKNIFIVENKITTLSFAPTENSIVIFGSGYGIGILKNVVWMREKNIFYWGDIDMDGFAILSQARSYFPQIKSLMMDTKTIEKFESLAIKTEDKLYKILNNLTESEQVVYERIYKDFYAENFRLEQEKISFKYVTKILDKT